MDWNATGRRVRKQREFLGYTREQFAERLEVTPKFCSDIELGLKGMSVPTLCHISEVLHLSTDYILFGTEEANDVSATIRMLQQCPPDKLHYIESILKMFLLAIDDKRD